MIELAASGSLHGHHFVFRVHETEVDTVCAHAHLFWPSDIWIDRTGNFRWMSDSGRRVLNRMLRWKTIEFYNHGGVARRLPEWLLRWRTEDDRGFTSSLSSVVVLMQFDPADRTVYIERTPQFGSLDTGRQSFDS